MDEITLYNIVHSDCGTRMTIEKKVPRSEIKEIIESKTQEEYEEWGQFGCYKVYLYGDDKEHYASKYQITGQLWYK